MNNRTEDLKIFIVSELKKSCQNVGYQRVNDDTLFPYIVFDMSHKRLQNGYYYALEINVFDKNRSSKVVENLADEIEDILDDTIFNIEGFTISIDLNARNNIEETDKNIQRRRLLFDAVYFN